MTPEDLATVARSWSALRRGRAALLAALTAHYDADVVDGWSDADRRAEWLLDAIDQLVPVLAAPSRLADAALAVGSTWPDPLSAPSFRVDGRAWMAAAGQCLPTWSDRTARAWRHAWLLLSDVLAAETLSPFGN